MEHIIRLGIVFTLCCCLRTAGSAQQLSWLRLAEDTMYYAREYNPERLNVLSSGPGQLWDMRSLRSPYAISKKLVTTGVRDGSTYANLINGLQVEGILLLEDRGAIQVQTIAENPVCRGSKLTYTLSPAYKPFFSGPLGDKYAYRGTMTATFAWSPGTSCSWTPLQAPDSCRVRYTLIEDIAVDGEGTLYLPTETAHVYRQSVERRQTVVIEAKYGRQWRDITAQVSGIRQTSSTSSLRFVSSGNGLLLAEVDLKDGNTPASALFKTHPVVTRIVNEEPNRPDIFAYPNPSYDIVRFQMCDIAPGKYKLLLYNILGVQVKQWDFDIDHHRKTVGYDLSDLPRGTYLYRLQDKNGRAVKTKRVTLIRS